MTALYNEIAYYAKNQLKDRTASIAVFGRRCEDLEAFLSNYNNVKICCEENLPNILQENEESFDAAIVLFKFHQFSDYKETEQFLCALTSLVKTGGFLQICEHTGDSGLNLSQYTNRFETHRNFGRTKCQGFSLLWEQCLNDTIHRKNDWNDHCWMLQKCEFALEDTKHQETVRAFLDQHQYTEFGIRSYEWIFGPGFISPGGTRQNGEFLAELDLKPGETVLDIGCGIGGNAFQIAREYGSNVIGVDLSSNMVTVACDRACLRRDTRVKFMIADITKYDFPPNTFEVIYSRDAIIHIPDKTHLFTKCYKWLKPGGRILITDYVVGEHKLSEEFVEYVKQRHYTLLPLSSYAQSAREAGFERVETVDITETFKKTIENEMERANENKIEFMQMFSAEKFDYLLSGWQNKIRYINNNDHKWGMLKAYKQRCQ